MKTSHQTFILEMVKHGDKELAWQKANPGNKGGNSARKAADRLLRRHPEMAAEIEEAVATIRHQAYKEAYRLYTEEQRTPLLSMMQRREILARIARGEVKVCRYVKNGDRYIMLFEDPRPRDMMQAMQIDAKFEEACNRMRNFNDPVLSQFNIYIDGRPCDDPAAPINTDLPPGIVMLPRKAKKILQEPSASGSEELSPAACLPRPFRGPDCFGSSLSQPKVGRGDPARAGTGVGYSRGTENTNPPLEKSTENGNPLATLSHQDREKQETPLLFLGGENGEMPTGMSHSGEVDSRRTLPQENSTQNGNPLATLGTQYTSPAQEKNPLENGNTSLVPNSVGGATLSSETTLSNATYPDPFGGDSLSPAGGGVTPVTGVGHSRGTENTRLDPVSPNSPLYHTYLNILEKRKLAEEDILHATWYSQHKRAEAAAPPPHILTDEEIAEMERTLAEERSRTLGQPQYSTFGKMYFPEKDTRCNL